MNSHDSIFSGIIGFVWHWTEQHDKESFTPRLFEGQNSFSEHINPFTSEQLKSDIGPTITFQNLSTEELESETDAKTKWLPNDSENLNMFPESLEVPSTLQFIWNEESTSEANIVKFRDVPSKTDNCDWVGDEEDITGKSFIGSIINCMLRN